MAPLLLSLLIVACILIFLDCAAGTKNIVLATASFSGVYLLIFYSRHAMASASCADERRFNIRAAWCASLILVGLLGFQVKQNTVQSTMVYVCVSPIVVVPSWPPGTTVCCAVHDDLCLDNRRKCPASCVDNY